MTWAAVLAHHQGHAAGAWSRMHELLPNGPVIEPGTITTGGFFQLQHLVAQPSFEPADLEVARVWLDAFDRWLEWSWLGSGTR